jgi:hypothetical protein
VCSTSIGERKKRREKKKRGGSTTGGSAPPPPLHTQTRFSITPRRSRSCLRVVGRDCERWLLGRVAERELQLHLALPSLPTRTHIKNKNKNGVAQFPKLQAPLSSLLVLLTIVSSSLLFSCAWLFFLLVCIHGPKRFPLRRLVPADIYTLCRIFVFVHPPCVSVYLCVKPLIHAGRSLVLGAKTCVVRLTSLTTSAPPRVRIA